MRGSVCIMRHLVAAAASCIEHGRPEGGLVAGVEDERGEGLPQGHRHLAVGAANGGAINLGG